MAIATLVDRLSAWTLTRETLTAALEALTRTQAETMYHAYGNAAAANRTLAVLCGVAGVPGAVLARAQHMVREAARPVATAALARNLLPPRPLWGLDGGPATAHLLDGGRRRGPSHTRRASPRGPTSRSEGSAGLCTSAGIRRA